MEQRLVDINKIKEVTLEDSLSILTYTPDNGVRCRVEADTVFTIPENPTNGDMIKALFPDAKVWTSFNNIYVCYTGNGDETHMYYDDWWNAPYKER